MKFKIINYRGCKHAEIELSKMTILFGKNGSGKTSVLDAIKSISTGNTDPFNDITKKNISMLIHNGEKESEIISEDIGGLSQIKYPDFSYAAQGNINLVSEISAGIKLFSKMKNSERMQYITEIMQAYPKKEDLIECFSKNEILNDETLIEKIWQNVEMYGWDVANKNAKEKGTKLKGQWEYVTGSKKYGSKIAESWLPDAFTLEVELSNEKALEENYNLKKEKYENAIKETILIENKMSELNKFKSTKKVLEQETKIIKNAYDIAIKERENKNKELFILEAKLKIDKILTCPNCKVQLIVSEEKLISIPGDYEKHIKELKNKISELKKEILSLDKQCDIQLKQYSEKISEIKENEINIINTEKLNAIPKEQKKEDIELLKKEMELSKDQLDSFVQYHKANKISNSIKLNKKICDILSPDGLRKKFLLNAISEINGMLKNITDTVNWHPITLNENLDVMYNGIFYGRLIAKSERYRTDVLLQLVISLIEKSSYVIIDDLDELVKTVRNELIQIILNNGINCILVCAIDEKDNIPNIKKIGGISYKIVDGISYADWL